MEPVPADLIARVVVDLPLPPLDYRLAERAPVGALCAVPVGRRSRVGVIVEVATTSTVDSGRLKEVACTSEVAPLDASWLALTEFAAEYYQHGWGEVAVPALPPLLKKAPGPRFKQALERVRRSGADAPSAPDPVQPILSAEQQQAVAALTGRGGFEPTLLFGVTGSGKTEVYLRSIEARLRGDDLAQALLLVPEIGLTPQLQALLRQRFGDLGVAALHSGLSAGERSANWLAAHEGRARIVVGTRLAVFASLPKLALIVVDEEHDASYKSGEGVRYSARDLAVKRAQLLGIPVLLGSATPSLETWAAAQSGRYALLKLSERAGADAPAPPSIDVVDLRATPPAAGTALSPQSIAALKAARGRGEQALVFLNRRGWAPVVTCDACGWLSHCPRCATFAVFHKPDRTLRCHHCGWTSATPRTCPTCGNPGLRAVGQGTQRIEEDLRSLLVDARVMRIDRDSTRRRSAAEHAFGQVHAGDVDVLVGTQMIAKGHDFRNVSLVVVVNADGQLVSHDFRAPERLFATLVQVAGRAGRGGHASRVIVQTRLPQHPLFAALRRHDYAIFANTLLAERRSAGMPPFTHQALLTAEAATMSAALAFLREARAAAPRNDAVRLFDPVPMALQRLAGAERAQLLVESDRRAPLQAVLRTWLGELRQRRARVRWQIEVDPQEI